MPIPMPLPCKMMASAMRVSTTKTSQKWGFWIETLDRLIEYEMANESPIMDQIVAASRLRVIQKGREQFLDERLPELVRRQTGRADSPHNRQTETV